MAVIEECLDGLRGLASAGLIDEVGTGDEPRQLEIHPFIGEVTATLLDGGTRVGVEPVLVRESAVAALGAAVRRLEPGRAQHWPWFRDLTPHVQRLLTASAEHIGSRRRAELLDCVMRCAWSSMWSRAEQHAEQLASAALALGQRLGCAGSEACLRVQHVLGWSLREQERYDEAAATLRHVLSQQVRLPGGLNRPDALHTRHDLAWTRGRQGHWAEAEREFHEVLRLRRAQLRQSGVDQDNADIMHTRCMLAWCVGKQGHWQQAERRYRQLAIDRAAILGADHPDTLDTTESLAKTLAWQGNWDTARAEFHRLAQAREDRLGRQHPDTLLAYQLEAYAAGYLAQSGGDRRSLRDAVRRLEDILGTQRSVRGDDHRNTRDTVAFLAVLRRSGPAPGWTEDLPEPMRPGG
jgi:tetratricopeptide (TPR) repeat protein